MQANFSSIVNFTIEQDLKPILHPLPFYIRIPFTISISFLIIFSNILGINVLRITQQIPYIPRICLINMGIADLTCGVFTVAPSVIPTITGEWPYGTIWCQISGVIHSTSLTNSMYTVALVSLDRYFAIVHSLKYRQIVTLRKLKLAIIGMWFVPIISFTFPIFLESDYQYYLYQPTSYLCGCRIRYLWFLLLTAPYMPILSCTVMTYTTLKIIRKLKEDKALTEDLEERKSRLVKNMKAVKVIVISANAFAMAFGPFIIVTFVDFISNKSIKHPPILDFLCMWSANVNSFVNVIIFVCVYSSFRKNAKNMLIRFFTCKICAREKLKDKLKERENPSRFSETIESELNSQNIK
ncbi:DgyrCDS2506 [Dimorphilus gyrociliatus]|uniref:DgyrCDS2506 n=1 Tax=Dimorphilus gyrociliatus TaxID=2664684 RepID=A0A7I8VCA3_9ANNE|nr:DgyrCDS2506 [Dimorphilus gyrociliatus]